MITFNLNLNGIEYPATVDYDNLILSVLNNGNGKAIEVIKGLILELLKEKDNPIVAIKLKEVQELLKNNL